MPSKAPRLVAIMGPTASGKSDVAEVVADHLNAQLVSADAFQVYRGFTIGTNKPGDGGRYAGIDIRDPHEDFGVGAFIEHTLPILEACFALKRDVVIVGGTGLYIRALLDHWTDLAPPPAPAIRATVMRRENEEGLESLARELTSLAPEVAARIDLKNGARVRRAMERQLTKQSPINWTLPKFAVHKFGLEVDVNRLNQRIEKRVDKMIQDGWIEEVRSLVSRGILETCPAFRAIGYAPLARLVREEVDRLSAFGQIVTETRQYAKRQRTWLRSEKGLQYVQEPNGEQNSVAKTVHALFNLLDTANDK